MAYTLSIDVAGPLKHQGVTPDSKGLRYFLRGAYRFPRLEGVSPEAGFPLLKDEDEEFSDGEEQPGDVDAFGAGVEPGPDETLEDGMPSEEEEEKESVEEDEGRIHDSHPLGHCLLRGADEEQESHQCFTSIAEDLCGCEGPWISNAPSTWR